MADECLVTGMMRVKNEARWINQCVRSMFPVCRRVFVFDDHSTDNTVAILQTIPNVVVLSSPFEGLNEARDKDYLLSQVLEDAPRWVLHIDGDEELEYHGCDRLRLLYKKYTNSDVAAIQFQVCYLWDTPQQWRIDGLYGEFHRPSTFKIPWVTKTPLRFTCTNGTNNFHCSNFPQNIPGRVVKSGIRLKHYGYMHGEDRMRKFKWYNEKDPNNTVEDNYRHLIGRGKHAPGPAQFAAWVD